MLHGQHGRWVDLTGGSCPQIQRVCVSPSAGSAFQVLYAYTYCIQQILEPEMMPMTGPSHPFGQIVPDVFESQCV